MKPPRKRIVRLALLVVVLTIGITSPLLTIFATTLMDASRVDPNQLISILGSQYGGQVLGVAVAVSASALLNFASNTAIIGCYHVCLALSRMHFFPLFVHRRNTWLGTPHYAITLATGIPIHVLILARLVTSGSQNVLMVLGEMYAFGLLGAFSLTCLGLDIVRFRERRWAKEQKRHWSYGQPESPSTRVVVAPQTTPQQQPAPASLVSTPMFVLGVLTTAIVMLAWSTNLVFKPLATAFGGSVTVIGLLIAFWIHHRTEKQGRQCVLAHHISHPIPGSVLALLPPTAADRQEIVHAACAEALHNIVVFLYRGQIPTGRPPMCFEIVDPYLEDEAAKQAFAEAEMLACECGVRRMYIYLLDGPEAVSQFWVLLQPRDTILSTKDDQATEGLALDRLPPHPATTSQVTHYIKDWSP